MSKCIFRESSLDNGQEIVTLGVKGCQEIAQASQAWESSITTSPENCDVAGKTNYKLSNLTSLPSFW